MDELGFNKIAAAVLATALGYLLLKEASHKIVHAESPETPAYALELPEVAGPAEVIELPFPQAEWVGAMDAARGAKVFKKCVSCHNNEAGGANGTGPNLYNIVSTASAAKDGFAYSSAMKTSGLTWDYETLDGFLERPGRYLSGTNMNFIGLKKPADRAAVIEYLRVGSANPAPRPEAAVLVTEESVVEAMPDAEMPKVTETPEMVEKPKMVEPH